MNDRNVQKFPHVIFFSGASGAGKTTLLEKLSQELLSDLTVYLHFDSIGVPSEVEMIKNYGSGSEWQKAMMFRWAKKLTSEYQDKKLVILEGQVNLSFIVSAFEAVNFMHYKIILVHCDAATRHARLRQDRNQPELINENMDNWSDYLKKQAVDMGLEILDTTSMSVDEMLVRFNRYL